MTYQQTEGRHLSTGCREGARGGEVQQRAVWGSGSKGPTGPTSSQRGCGLGLRAAGPSDPGSHFSSPVSTPLPPSRQEEVYFRERIAELGIVVRLTGKGGID